MFMLTLKQKAALQVAQLVGYAVFCAICTMVAINYIPFQILLILALVMIVIWSLTTIYDLFLLRLKAAEQLKELVDSFEKK